MWMSFIGFYCPHNFYKLHLLYLGTIRSNLSLNAIPYATICGAITVLALYQFIETKKTTTNLHGIVIY